MKVEGGGRRVNLSPGAVGGSRLRVVVDACEFEAPERFGRGGRGLRVVAAPITFGYAIIALFVLVCVRVRVISDARPTSRRQKHIYSAFFCSFFFSDLKFNSNTIGHVATRDVSHSRNQFRKECSNSAGTVTRSSAARRAFVYDRALFVGTITT